MPHPASLAPIAPTVFPLLELALIAFLGNNLRAPIAPNVLTKVFLLATWLANPAQKAASVAAHQMEHVLAVILVSNPTLLLFAHYARLVFSVQEEQIFANNAQHLAADATQQMEVAHARVVYSHLRMVRLVWYAIFKTVYHVH